MSISIDLVGKRILVVGGSAGIGRGIALAVGKAGATIAVVGRRAERLHEVVKTEAALDRSVRAWRLERPDKRFVCLAVGDTVGTEFSRNFDLEKAAVLAPKWVAAGVIYEQRMEAADLGLGIAEILALLLAHPRFTIPELTIVPPGPMLSGRSDELRVQLAER